MFPVTPCLALVSFPHMRLSLSTSIVRFTIWHGTPFHSPTVLTDLALSLQPTLCPHCSHPAFGLHHGGPTLQVSCGLLSGMREPCWRAPSCCGLSTPLVIFTRGSASQRRSGRAESTDCASGDSLDEVTLMQFDSVTCVGVGRVFL